MLTYGYFGDQQMAHKSPPCQQLMCLLKQHFVNTFGHAISNLILGINFHQLNFRITYILFEKMIFDIDVFGTRCQMGRCSQGVRALLLSSNTFEYN